MAAPTAEHPATMPCLDCGHAPWGHGLLETKCFHKGCTCAGYDPNPMLLTP